MACHQRHSTEIQIYWCSHPYPPVCRPDVQKSLLAASFAILLCNKRYAARTGSCSSSAPADARPCGNGKRAAFDGYIIGVFCTAPPCYFRFRFIIEWGFFCYSCFDQRTAVAYFLLNCQCLIGGKCFFFLLVFLKRGCSTSDMWCHQQLCRKNPIVCLWRGMNGLWGGTESDPLSLMPDCRFGFLFSYLLHFFC